MLCVKFEIDRMILEKNLFFNLCLLFHYYLPLKKAGDLHLNKLETPSQKGCFVQSLVAIGLMVLEKKLVNIKQCVLAISLSSPFL